MTTEVVRVPSPRFGPVPAAVAVASLLGIVVGLALAGNGRLVRTIAPNDRASAGPVETVGRLAAAVASLVDRLVEREAARPYHRVPPHWIDARPDDLPTFRLRGLNWQVDPSQI